MSETPVADGPVEDAIAGADVVVENVAEAPTTAVDEADEPVVTETAPQAPRDVEAEVDALLAAAPAAGNDHGVIARLEQSPGQVVEVASWWHHIAGGPGDIPVAHEADAGVGHADDPCEGGRAREAVAGGNGLALRLWRALRQFTGARSFGKHDGT